MSILPDLLPGLQDIIEQTEEPARERGKSYLFDFDKGDFVVVDGKLQLVDGVESLKIWTEKVLRTEKGKSRIYEGTEYGVRLTNLLNKGYPQGFIESEIEREVSEALLRNPEIKEVSNFRFTREKRGLKVEFDVQSVYGSTAGEVMF